MTSSEQLSGPAFHERKIDGWVYLVDRIATRLRTGDFAMGATLVARIAAVAEEMDHHPDLDLRYPWLDVTVNSHDAGGVTERDVQLALAINALAAEAEVALEPRARQRVELALDTADFTRLGPFWTAVSGRALSDKAPEDEVVDPSGQLPVIWFQHAPEPSQRFHLDLWVDPAEVPARIAAATEAGGRLVSDADAPSFWVLADPDGNHVCLCTWQDRA